VADAYQVLGLSRDASIDDAEQAYHHRLLRCHPDLHASEGPEAVARAEAETLALNEAIHEIRHGSGSGGTRTAATGATGASRPRTSTASGGSTWPGTADRGRDHPPVPCPFCGEPMTSLRGFEDHLARDHPSQDRRRRRPTRRAARSRRWWWPVPVWLFAVLDAVVVATAIMVVTAIGGHRVVVEAVLGDDAPAECVPTGADRVAGFWSRGGCHPDDWPMTYVAVGVLALLFFVAWRWTTTRREP
jgi:hypothetical protein